MVRAVSDVGTVIDPDNPCGSFDGEAVLGASGQWIGDFNTIYHPSPDPVLGDPVWPTGFVCVGYIGQQTGENGNTPFATAAQWKHGTKLVCVEDEPNPHYRVGLFNILGGGGVVTDHIVCPSTLVINSTTTSPQEWATANIFDWIFTSSNIGVVADSSGPTGLEDANALVIDFSGYGSDEGVTYIGEGGGHLFDGPGAGYGWDVGLLGDGPTRSTTGWHVDNDQCWTADFWIKAVPDDDGFVCSGYGIRARTGFYPDFQNFGSSPLILDGTWQHYVEDMTWFASPVDPMNNAVLGIGTRTSNIIDCVDKVSGLTVRLATRKGRVHIKCLHLYPCHTTRGLHLKLSSGYR